MDPITPILAAGANSVATNQGTVDYILDRFFGRKDWYFKKDHQHKIIAEILELEKDGNLSEDYDKYCRYVHLNGVLKDTKNIEKAIDLRARTHSYLLDSGKDFNINEPSKEFESAFQEYTACIPDIEKVKDTWAKLLANEINVPNSISVRTMAVLKNLSSIEAALFTKITPGLTAYHRIIRPYHSSSGQALPELNITYNELIKLADAGLLNRTESSVMNYITHFSEIMDYIRSNKETHHSLSSAADCDRLALIGNRVFAVKSNTSSAPGLNIEILSTAGAELAKIFFSGFDNDYLAQVEDSYLQNNLKLVRLPLKHEQDGKYYIDPTLI